MRCYFNLVFLVLLFSTNDYAQIADAHTGEPPRLSLGARDVAADYHLPRLSNQPEDSLWRTVSPTQVISRARSLGITASSATQAWRQGEDTYARATAAVGAPVTQRPILSSATRASALNLLLARHGPISIEVTSPSLLLDEPIRIHRSHLRLDLGHTRLDMRSTDPYMIRIENAEDVQISGGIFVHGGWGVLAVHSRFVTLKNLDMGGLSGGGILISNTSDCLIWANKFLHLGATPIMLHGETTKTVVAENTISGNLNSSNWRAGIVLTDRNADLSTNPDSLLNPDLVGVKEDPMANRVNIPHDNVIADNWITYNQSSAIYSDGAARNVITGNHIEGNAQEGICLDNGSLANIVAYNLFQTNGKRWGKTDFQLQREFIFNFGRLPDGSSPAKVPAVSMDNAAYNEVMFNEITGNYGSGIKFVRTAFYNIVGLNTVTDNNQGRSERFHFFGIELGFAPADVKVKDLDFLPSQGNILFGNIIRGSHYAGIFFAAGSDRNDIFDNSIFGATNWAMESVQPQSNFSLNNFSNQPSRNIGSGLDPALQKISAGRFDTTAVDAGFWQKLASHF